MTIGIAATFPDGVILCSDTRITAWDGSTTSESKAFMSVTATKRLFAVSYAGEDVNAAKMVAREIDQAACNADKWNDIGPTVKKIMGEWYRSYGHTSVPFLQFLLVGIDVENEYSAIYLCEPPNTVYLGSDPIVIGSGNRVVAPMLGLIATRAGKQLSLRTYLLRMAYLMHLAKEHAGSGIGGRTQVIILSTKGSFTFIDRDEMEQAEEVGKQVASLLEKLGKEILDADEKSDFSFLDELASECESAMQGCSKAEFLSLGLLDKPIWKPKKRSISGKSEGQQ